MPSRHALTVSLTSELGRFVAGEAASNRYGSASEVMRAGLPLLARAGTSAGTAPATGEQEAPRRVGARAVRAAQRTASDRG